MTNPFHLKDYPGCTRYSEYVDTVIKQVGAAIAPHLIIPGMRLAEIDVQEYDYVLMFSDGYDSISVQIHFGQNIALQIRAALEAVDRPYLQRIFEGKTATDYIL